MRVVFSDGPECDYSTLKRLVLVADEIGFMDRSGILFGDGGDGSWGFLGMQSPVRRWDTEGMPVRISVHAPPSGRIATARLYRGCASTDLGNAEFVRTFLDGLARDAGFAEMFLQLDAEYRPGGERGAEIRAALVADPTLRSAPLVGDVDDVDAPTMYQVDSHEHRVNTLRSLIVDASVRVSSTLVISGGTGLVPISANPHFARLLAVRTAGSGYVGRTPRSAAALGLAISKAVIPECVLEKLELKDLCEYRQDARDAYTAWSLEIDGLATRISEVPPDRAEEEIRKIITAEVAPRLNEYRREMEATRDRLWLDLMKRVIAWELPTLALSYVADITPVKALVAMAAAAGPAVGDVLDYFAKRDDIDRKHAMAYLIGVTPGKG